MSWNLFLFLYFFLSSGIKLKLCVVSLQDRARRWVALRAKRTKVLQWSISRRTRWCRTPTPPPRLTLVTTGLIPPSYSRISLPRPHLPLEPQISTTASHRLEAPRLPWLPLEGCRPLSLVLCLTHSLVLSQVSSLYVVAALMWRALHILPLRITLGISLLLSLISVILSISFHPFFTQVLTSVQNSLHLLYYFHTVIPCDTTMFSVVFRLKPVFDIWEYKACWIITTVWPRGLTCPAANHEIMDPVPASALCLFLLLI